MCKITAIKELRRFKNKKKEGESNKNILIISYHVADRETAAESKSQRFTQVPTRQKNVTWHTALPSYKMMQNRLNPFTVEI